MSTIEYSSLMEKIDFNNLDSCIKKQKEKLYLGEKFTQPASLIHSESVMSFLEAAMPKNKCFRSFLQEEIDMWTQHMVYKDQSIFVRYVHLLEVVY